MEQHIARLEIPVHNARKFLDALSNLPKNLDGFCDGKNSSCLQFVGKTPIRARHDDVVAANLGILTRIEYGQHVFEVLTREFIGDLQFAMSRFADRRF